MSQTQFTGHVRSNFTIMQSPLWDMMPCWYVQQLCFSLARSLLLQHRLLLSNMFHNRSHASCLLQACACVVWGFPHVAEHVVSVMRQGKTDITVLLVPDSSISHFGCMLPHAALMNSNREQHPLHLSLLGQHVSDRSGLQ